MLDSNYDINVWDKVGYFTEYKKEGWVLTPYTIVKNGDSFGSGEEMLEHEIRLTKREAQRLTLGLDKAEGGDYTPDADFWVDAIGFYVIYRNIPRRVDNKLRAIMEVVANK
mgnify:CR=1 FL=1